MNFDDIVLLIFVILIVVLAIGSYIMSTKTSIFSSTDLFMDALLNVIVLAIIIWFILLFISWLLGKEQPSWTGPMLAAIIIILLSAFFYRSY